MARRTSESQTSPDLTTRVLSSVIASRFLHDSEIIPIVSSFGSAETSYASSLGDRPEGLSLDRHVVRPLCHMGEEDVEHLT